jgi:hypothetical protein
MIGSELIALLPGHGPPTPPDGYTIVQAGDHAAVLRRGGLLPLVRRADAWRAAAERARVLETLMSGGTVLPVLPGQRLRKGEVARLVVANLPVLERLADRVAMRRQYQITVHWDVARAVARFAHLPNAEGAEPLLATIATDLRGRIASFLLGTGAEVLPLPVAGDVVANAVVLVDAGSEAALDAALARIDALWSEGFRTRMIGPYPPVSFASLVFDRMDRPAIEAARKAFGLPSGFSESALRTARRELMMRSRTDAHEALRLQADLLTCIARLGEARAPVHVARIWTEGMSSVSVAAARAA